MKFSDFDLQPSLINSLTLAGFNEPTAIQMEVIPTALTGKNIVGQSQTGTGKTGAFMIPLLNGIDAEKRTTQALILGPTRELVSQIREDAFNLSRSMMIRSTAVYGGAALYGQKKDLDRKPHIVTGTPGRTMDFIERGILDLSTIEFLILDEVDRMLDMGFVQDIEYIWENCKNLKQVFAFSATITPDIRVIIEKHLGVDYTFVKSGDTITVEKIDHSFMEVPHFEKYEMLKEYLETHRKAEEKVLVFTETKRNTEQLVGKLEDDGFEAGYINGDMKQSQRFRMMDRYKKGLLQILVTTDVAARGLNLGHIHLVINYDVPNDPESYIHRIGRTGRAGKEGKAIMFVSKNEGEALYKVEKSNKIRIKKVDSEGVEVRRDEAAERRNNTENTQSGRGGRSGGRSSSSSARSGGSSARGGRSTGYRGTRDGTEDRNVYGDKKPAFSDRKPSREATGEKREWTPRKPSFGTSRNSGDAETSSAGRAPRPFSDRKPSGDRKPFGDRPKRDFDAPRAPRESKPFFSNVDSDARPSFGGEQSPRKPSFGNRKPAGEFSSEKREWTPRKPREDFGDRKSSFGGDRPERKTFGDRKPFGDRPKRDFDKPFGEKKEGGERREWAPRKPREDFGDKKPFGDKKFPPRKPFKKRES